MNVCRRLDIEGELIELTCCVSAVDLLRRETRRRTNDTLTEQRCALD